MTFANNVCWTNATSSGSLLNLEIMAVINDINETILEHQTVYFLSKFITFDVCQIFYPKKIYLKKSPSLFVNHVSILPKQKKKKKWVLNYHLLRV